jgi:hypothetical protein
MPEDCREVVWIPTGAFSSEFDASLVVGGSDEIEGEVSDDRHVFRAVTGSEARLIVAEGDIENPMQAVLDGPVGANGLGCAGGAERGG